MQTSAAFATLPNDETCLTAQLQRIGAPCFCPLQFLLPDTNCFQSLFLYLLSLLYTSHTCTAPKTNTPCPRGTCPLDASASICHSTRRGEGQQRPPHPPSSPTLTSSPLTPYHPLPIHTPLPFHTVRPRSDATDISPSPPSPLNPHPPTPTPPH